MQSHPFNAVAPERVLRLIEASDDIIPESDNPTMVPQEILLRRGTVPVLTIRDPRLAVPSAYKVLREMGFAHATGKPNFLHSTSVVWNRLLYNFFVSRGVEPVIVDADDLMTMPEYLHRLCKRLGLNQEELQLTWPAISPEEKQKLHPMHYTSQKNLFNSTGINAGRAASNLDLEAEEKTWDTEFGDDAAMVREMVQRALPHYEYLHDRRFRK